MRGTSRPLPRFLLAAASLVVLGGCHDDPFGFDDNFDDNEFPVVLVNEAAMPIHFGTGVLTFPGIKVEGGSSTQIAKFLDIGEKERFGAGRNNEWLAEVECTRTSRDHIEGVPPVRSVVYSEENGVSGLACGNW